MSLRLSRGILVSLDGQLCEVRRRFGDRVELQQFGTGEVRTPTDAEIDEMFVAGRLTLRPRPSPGMPAAGGSEPDIAAVPAKARRELERRLFYIKPFLARPGVRRTAKAAATFLAECFETYEDDSGARLPRPAARTLLHWCRRYGGGEPGALLALAPRHWRSGRARPPEHDAVEAILAEVLRDTLMRAEKPPIGLAYDRVKARIDAENRVRVPGAKLFMPSKATVYRRVRTLLDPYEYTKAREGKREADRQFGGVGPGVRADRPLERVIMDHTIVDVLVTDDRERPLFVARPTLTVLIDVFSRCIVGFFLSFEPPSFAQAAIALRRAILPKVRLGSEELPVRHPWPCSGIMETLVVDNGKEFHSGPFRTACAVLGITLAYAPVREPKYKAIGERFFGTLNKRGIHCIPGTTRSNPQNRGEYPSADKAQYTLAELDALLTKIIVDDYHQTLHSTLERPPTAVWAEGFAQAPPTPPVDARELRIALGWPEKRQIRPEGIVYEKLWFQPGIEELRRRLGNGAEVEIRVDPLDLGRIHVLDAAARRFVEVSCTDPDYASGLPLYSHLKIREETRQKGRSETDPADLAQTREEIWQALQGKRRRRRGPPAAEVAVRGGKRAVRGVGGLETARFDADVDPAADPAADGTVHRNGEPDDAPPVPGPCAEGQVPEALDHAVAETPQERPRRGRRRRTANVVASSAPIAPVPVKPTPRPAWRVSRR